MFLNLLRNLPEDWDVVVLSNYDADSNPFEIPQKYSTVYLFAWSFGVAAAERLVYADNITMAFAVNGSPFPVDDNLGIPHHIFNGTLENLNLRNLKKFHRRMVESAEDFNTLVPLLPTSPDIDGLRDELRFFGSIPHKHPALPWKRVFVAEEDRIIPPNNQVNAWKSLANPPEIVKLQGGHYPDFLKILKSVLPDTKAVATHFSSSLGSYDDSAYAQKKIAEYLGGKLERLINTGCLKNNNLKVLEIGSGSGILTKKWGCLLKNSEASFIDLYTLPRYGIVEKEIYIVDDAEEWIKKTNDRFDLIISASTMQWFANPLGFIRQAFDRLNPGGILLLSTFLPGNLGELDKLRPAPVIYRSESDFFDVIKNLTDDFSIEKGKIEVRFDNPRLALLHLRRTGVGHSPVKTKSRIEIESALRMPDGAARLTFLPLYLTLRKSKTPS